jgi:hypothetical protein
MYYVHDTLSKIHSRVSIFLPLHRSFVQIMSKSLLSIQRFEPLQSHGTSDGTQSLPRPVTRPPTCSADLPPCCVNCVNDCWSVLFWESQTGRLLKLMAAQAFGRLLSLVVYWDHWLQSTIFQRVIFLKPQFPAPSAPSLANYFRGARAQNPTSGSKSG